MNTYSVNIDLFIRANDRNDLEKSIEFFVHSNPDILMYAIKGITKFEDKAAASA